MGPLNGVKVIEIAGLGAAPFGVMCMADMGAEVIRIDRANGGGTQLSDPSKDLLNRGRRSVALDLKHPEAIEVVLSLCESADVIVEGFRPGVMERLGLGPDVCMGRNEKLIYARMTGWGQDGPLAGAAGHDINYVALSGALHTFGRAGDIPVPPVNVVGDFGGGGLLMAYGVVCALLEAGRSGKGQVVDAAMIDGAALFTTMMHGMMASGVWRDERGVNFIDTGAHFYDVFETKDGKYLSLGAIEPQFYAEMLDLLGLADDADFQQQMNPAKWSELKEKIATRVGQRTRAEWSETMEGSDACAAGVLSLTEAPAHPHNVARETFVEVAGITQPAPAPRFSRTTPTINAPPPNPGQHTSEALADWGVEDELIRRLIASGAATEVTAEV